MAKIIPIHPIDMPGEMPGEIANDLAMDQQKLLKALRQEIARSLQQVLNALPAEEYAVIDLSSLPLRAESIEHFDNQLEKGEVNATVCDHAGSVEIWESRFHGVWRLRFRDSHGNIFLEQLEIARIPRLLLANPADMAQAREKLSDDFVFYG